MVRDWWPSTLVYDPTFHQKRWSTNEHWWETLGAVFHPLKMWCFNSFQTYKFISYKWNLINVHIIKVLVYCIQYIDMLLSENRQITIIIIIIIIIIPIFSIHQMAIGGIQIYTLRSSNMACWKIPSSVWWFCQLSTSISNRGFSIPRFHSRRALRGASHLVNGFYMLYPLSYMEYPWISPMTYRITRVIYGLTTDPIRDARKKTGPPSPFPCLVPCWVDPRHCLSFGGNGHQEIGTTYFPFTLW